MLYYLDLFIYVRSSILTCYGGRFFFFFMVQLICILFHSVNQAPIFYWFQGLAGGHPDGEVSGNSSTSTPVRNIWSFYRLLEEKCESWPRWNMTSQPIDRRIVTKHFAKAASDFFGLSSYVINIPKFNKLNATLYYFLLL